MYWRVYVDGETSDDVDQGMPFAQLPNILKVRIPMHVGCTGWSQPDRFFGCLFLFATVLPFLFSFAFLFGFSSPLFIRVLILGHVDSLGI
jgi:hypothetical protein